MPQLPEQIRPYVAAIAKYHFWILAAIVPVVLVPMLMLGTGSLDALIGGQRSQIENRVSASKHRRRRFERRRSPSGRSSGRPSSFSGLGRNDSETISSRRSLRSSRAAR
jgi:hypothetical protein